MDMFTVITVVALVVVGVVVARNKQLRQRLENAVAAILGRGANSMSTSLEQAEQNLARYAEKIKAYRGRVAKVKAQKQMASSDLQKLEEVLKSAKTDYRLAKQAEDQELADSVALKVASIEQEKQAQLVLVQDLAQQATEISNELASEEKRLVEYQRTLKSKKGKAEAAIVLKEIAQTRSEVSTLTGLGSAIDEDLRKVDEEYEVAKAELELSGGDSTERKMEELREKQRAEEARRKLDAELEAENQ
jgi:phage shock protein A